MEIEGTATAKGTIRVLIVDDDADIGKFMGFKLSMEAPHFSTAAVESGPECLEYLKSNPVDCILSDYQMPEMDGMELLLALREAGSDVPFIFVTGQGNEGVAREAFKNGAYDYFTKEIGFAHFARIINSVEQAVAQRVSEAGRRSAAEAVKQYQQRLQLHVRQTPLAVIDWDTDFRVVSWNPSAEKVFGYPAAEAIGRHAAFIVADSAKPQVDRVWGDLLTRRGGERSTNENVTKDGRTILCEWYNTPLVADDGKVIGVSSLVHDISVSRQAEDALLASEKRFRAVVENAADAFFLHDSKGGIVDVNQAACETLGYTREELLRMSVQDIEMAFAASKVAELWDKEVPNRPVTINGVHRRKDGTTFPVEVRVGLLDVDGESLFLALARDVTERKKAEEALKEKERALTALIDANPESVMLVDAKGIQLAANSAYARRLGRYRDEITGCNAFDLLPPALAASRKAHLDEVLRTCRAVCFEDIRDGRVIENYMNPVIEADGHASAVAIVGVDVTERREAQEALKFKNALLSAQHEASIDGILVVDEKDEIISYNKRFIDMWRIPPEVIAAKSGDFALQSVLDNLDEPQKFVERIKYLYEHPAEKSTDEVRLRDGRTFDRYSAPMFGDDGKYYGRVWYYRDITNRRKVEEALQEAERFLNSVFASIQDGVVVLDNDFKIIRVNPTIEKWYPASMPFVGKKCYEAFHGRHEVCENCPSVQTMKTGKAASEVVPKHVPGDEAGGWLELYSFPLVDPSTGRQNGVIEYLRDITERRQAEKDKERLLKGVSSCTEGIAFADRDDRYISVNAAYAGIYGYSPEELIGKTWMDLTPSEMVGSCEWQLARSLKDKAVGEFTTELPALRKDGTIIQTEVIATSLWEEDGRYGGHVCIVRDITERKNLERQRSDFFAMVTHDLKSPLTTILGYTELISEKAKDKGEKDIAEMAKVAFQSGRKLLRLVEDFMAAARMETSGVQLCMFPEEASRLLLEVRNDFEPLAKKKRIIFRINVPDSLPRAFLDKKQVERAVGNLLQNAFNYTPRGGEVTLSAEAAQRGEGKYVVISVSDTGPGIPPDECEKIFNKYYRSPKTSGLKGTGLGLAIVKAIAEAHGGRVEVESEEGKGSTFRLFLPVGGSI